ncbi:MAG TPA: c-type cytochrome [Thiobacillaceae bacterium]|nr:c-type cytochrome [Thiobacillaceae bacterium]
MQARILTSLILLSALAACGKEESAPPPATETQPAAVAEAPAAAPAAEPSPADAAMERGRIKYGSICAGCHGKNGEGMGIFPKVAGKPAQELAAKLRDYRAGKTLGEQTAMMAPNAQNLTDEEIDSLANFMTGLKG